MFDAAPYRRPATPTRPPRLQLPGRRGITLIELVVFMLFIGCAVLGGGIGSKMAFGMGRWCQMGGMLLGAVAGGAAAIAAIFLLMLPFEIYAAVRRALQPANLICRCRDPNVSVPDHLLPTTAIEGEAMQKSRHWADWDLIVRLHLERAPASDALRSHLSLGELSEEQLSLAACLGEPAAAGLVTPASNPAPAIRASRKLPADLRQVLGSGLPPRLCMVWAMTCAVRALAEFEGEFHQDTRPRQRFGASFMALREDDDPEIAATLVAWRRKGWYLGRNGERGCRVLHRSLAERIRGSVSRGERASDAVLRFSATVADFIEPATLWRVYPSGDIANAHLTSRTRCEWTLPSHGAEDVALKASQAAPSPEEEFARQRTELARMVLAWKTWEEDREAWRTRLEQEWIPKIESVAADLPFDMAKYIALVRETHLPWLNRERV